MAKQRPQNDEQRWQTKLANNDIWAQRKAQAKAQAAKNGGGAYQAWSPDGSFSAGAVDKYGNEVGSDSWKMANGRATATSNNTTGTGDIDKDWTNANGNFSFNNDDLMKQAKELSQLQLSNAKEMMGLSAGFRNNEYGFRAGTDRDTYSHKAGEDRTSYTAKTTDDMRVNNQQYGFQDALQRLKQTHELGMQEGQFKQQRSMFDAQQEADSRRKFNDRVASANLYNSSRSAFPGMYNFRG